jgi:hypothetical protein
MAMDKLGLGRRIERLVMGRWYWAGFTCWQPPRAQYRKVVDGGTDIFGLFDFIAVKPFCSVNLVQVKRYRAKELETARDAISAFADEYHAPIRCFLVYWRRNALKRICFVVEEYTLTGWGVTTQWAVDA